MTPSNENSKDSVRASTNHAHQEQVLLEALQGFILPHIGAAVDVNSQKEIADKLAGPQARKLVAALKEFILSLVGCPAKTEVETTIEVALDEVSAESSCPAVETATYMALDEGVHSQNLYDLEYDPTLASPRSYHDRSDFTDESDELEPSVPKLTFQEKLLQALHYQVFNKTPIRLLRFVQNGAKLEISVIERAAIYEHLVSVLQAKLHDVKYKPIIPGESEDQAVGGHLWKFSRYAILSHTCLREAPEVTYGDKAKSFDVQGPGYRKLVNFCKVAYTMHGLTLGWMDTVCINKESSSELDESIRSMYKWYERSKICVVHLADTGLLGEMHKDSWFTRGWTLQELLAPSVLKFYNRLWKTLTDSKNDKEDDSITTKIGEATTMSNSELKNIQFLVPISRKMQLAAHRKVTREEDTAYSLMGLFNVSFTTAYGEGAERAFYRLLQEILNSQSYGVLDLFNWAGSGHSYTSKLFPNSPRHYLSRSLSVNLQDYQPIEPLTSTHMGIRIPVLLMPAISINQGDPHIKPCGNYGASVSVFSMKFLDIDIYTTYILLQHQESRYNHFPYSPKRQFAFAVFNIGRRREHIVIPKKCIAILLDDYYEGNIDTQCKRIPTRDPVVFEMLQRNPHQDNEWEEDYMVGAEGDGKIRIPQQDLEKHGMQLVFTYL